MQVARLRWYGSFDINDIYELDFQPFNYTEGFYMFLHKSKILYIGQVYWKSLKERINEHLRGDSLWRWIERNHNSKKVSIKIAEIKSMDQERITRQLVNDIESLLIITQQPEGNMQSIRIYYGRDLKIVNLGEHAPLPKTLSSDMLN